MKISYLDLEKEFLRVLLKHGVSSDNAGPCAHEFAETTAYGVVSHGVNRFPVFIGQLDKGEVKPHSNPVKVGSFGSIEQWDGQQGIGNLIAKKMMDRAMEIASLQGIGIVALRNTNHWMRGGSYGYQGAKKGFISICWTNSIAVMPAWGAKQCCIGTNPLIIAVPTSPITMIDMSMSMFSYGKLQNYRLAGKELPIDGGFDNDGNYTRDPATIEANKRILPMGYWKGSGLSIVLDMIVTMLSGGLSVSDITKSGSETNVSQIFIAIKPSNDGVTASMEKSLKDIVAYVENAEPSDPKVRPRVPGQEFEKRYQKSMTEGIEVNDSIFEKIKSL